MSSNSKNDNSKNHFSPQEPEYIEGIQSNSNDFIENLDEVEDSLADSNNFSRSDEAYLNNSAKDSSTFVIAQLQASLKIKEKEIEDWKAKAYRFSADLQNLSKQNELDLQQASKRGKKSVIQLLLPFINTMNLSFSYIPKSSDESLTTFVNTLKSSFEKLMSDFAVAGIEFLVPAIGDEVDTTYMQVLNTTNDDEHIVAQVIGVGVRVDGQLIEEASVMI